MKRKSIIIIASICIILTIIIVCIIINNNVKSKKEEEISKQYELVNELDNETEEIDNELEKINNQIKELEENENIDSDNKEENENKISELRKKQEELNNKKEDNEKKKSEVLQQTQQVSQQRPQQIQKPIQDTSQQNQQVSQENSQQNQQQNIQQDIAKNEQKEETKQYKITASPTNVTVQEGKFVHINLNFSRENVKDDDIFFEQDNPICSIGWTINSKKNGIEITGTNAGTTTILVKDSYGLGAFTTIKVTVTPKVTVTGITIDKTSIDGKIGETHKINASVVPADALKQYIAWSSSNENIATVWQGNVKLVGEGTAIITAKTSEGGYVAECEVNSKSVPVEGIKITTPKKEVNYHKGDTVQLEYTTIPYNATNKKVIWKSDNLSIATVDNKGLVTFHGGFDDYKFVHITVTTENGKYSDRIGLYCIPAK